MSGHEAFSAFDTNSPSNSPSNAPSAFENLMPNAFVSETTPYTIYVTTSILENVISNDDELALLLGHELSHLLLAHSTQAMEAERNLKTLEVVSNYFFQVLFVYFP